eukprot:COSAG05_NODE_25871_length_193_cov_8.829787_1_plen_22_part_10
MLAQQSTGGAPSLSWPPEIVDA